MTETPRDSFAGAMREAQRPTGPLVGSIVAIVLFASVMATSILLAIIPGITTLGLTIVSALAFLPVWILLWVWLRFKERRPFPSIGFRTPSRAPLQIARGAAIALGAMALAVAVAVLTGNMEFLQTEDGAYAYWPAIGWVIFALVAFSIQSGAEELISRGYLIQSWMPRAGILGAMIAQSVFFTLAHSLNTGLNIMSVFSLVLVSLLLGFWALSEGALWGVIAFHATWNWAQNSLFGIPVSGIPAENSLYAVVETTDANPLVSGGLFGLEASVTTVVMLAIMTAVTAVFWARGRNNREG
ncbi:CPBP family intramembrane metalloprotease [Microbacterium schleiferi]|uniref:CPBP family intramembrane metalloprotease n=1 Tax=Microbacterium schleiferi TaxID=69362 RepID=A0A7S8RI27_9MICO|nr:type II CAAX endopeptidase family protein [Microbacterium schleiferi]QPE04956.1 CPBP family intramembrane metalloprotease [Microbacterium schleiferi]